MNLVGCETELVFRLIQAEARGELRGVVKWRHIMSMHSLRVLLLIVPASHALRSTQISRRSAVSGVLLVPAAVAIGGARAGATTPPVAYTMTPIAAATDASTSTEFLSGLIAGFAQ